MTKKYSHLLISIVLLISLQIALSVCQNETIETQFDIHLYSFHWKSGCMNDQHGSHFYCKSVNEDVVQCLMFNGTLSSENSALKGVAYSISRTLFASLPSHERIMYHSHVFDVKNGLFAFPDDEDDEERREMILSRLINGYGKLIMIWDPMMTPHAPIGFPKLMYSFTDEGQIDEEMVSRTYEEYGWSREDLISAAENIEPEEPLVTGVDAWQYGTEYQFTLENIRPGSNYHCPPSKSSEMPSSS